MHTSRTVALRRRKAGAALGAIALGLTGALVATASAQAAEQPVESGELGWGFKQSFRNYVGAQIAALPPIGALPFGERITLIDPAQFDLAGTPATPSNPSDPNETLPYLFPVTGGSVTDEDNLRIETSGGVQYHFPSHFFEIEIENFAVVVEDGVVTLEGDAFQETTEAFGDFPAGTFEADGIPLATVANATVTVTEESVTITATGVALTAEGAEILPQSEGEALDDFTVTAALGEATGEPEPTQGSVVVSETELPAEGTTAVTVAGTGFDPAAAIGTRPPLSGQQAGVYVVFGKFADVWQPSTGAASSTRSLPGSPNGNGVAVIWALPQASYDTLNPSGTNPAYALLNADGTFEVTVQVNQAWLAEAAGNYGIYTYGGSGAAPASYETATPLTFVSDEPGEPGEGDLDIEVTVPEVDEPGEPGEFIWRIDGGVTAVSLGTAAVEGDAFVATGALAPIVVTDTREGAPAWSISGQVGDFTSSAGSFAGSFLGWTPAVLAEGGGAVAGAAVAPGFPSGSGLSEARTLGSAVAGHALGSATLGGALRLQLPLTTPEGDYTGTLTLTAIS